MHESVQKGETRPTSRQLRTLLEVAEEIVSNREVSALFKNLAGLLHRVARFDHLWLNLHNGAGDTLRLNVMEPADPGAPAAPLLVQDLAMWVWQNQLPVVTSITSQAEQWPDYYQWAQRLNMNSLCVLPLTTAGRLISCIWSPIKWRWRWTMRSTMRTRWPRNSDCPANATDWVFCLRYLNPSRHTATWARCFVISAGDSLALSPSITSIFFCMIRSVMSCAYISWRRRNPARSGREWNCPSMKLRQDWCGKPSNHSWSRMWRRKPVFPN